MRKKFLNQNFTFIDRKKGLTHVVLGICPEKIFLKINLTHVRPENFLTLLTSGKIPPPLLARQHFRNKNLPLAPEFLL
jgi:hypothetical protein